MKNVVLKYGLLAALIQLIIGYGLMALWNNNGETNIQLGEILGYTSMIVSLSLIFFGIKAYRDQQEGAIISFGQALKIGLLITLIASAVYVIAWMIYYHLGGGEAMMNGYVAQATGEMQNSGKSQVEIDQEIKTMKDFMQTYQEQPLVMIGVSFMEIFPVGFIISLIAAALLKRKPEGANVA